MTDSWEEIGIERRAKYEDLILSWNNTVMNYEEGRMASKGPISGISIIRKKKIHIPKNQKIIEISTQSDEPMNPTSFLEIKDGLCRWPIGEPENSNFKFCGRNTNEGFVYCQAHHKKAYQPLTAVRERRKIKRKFRVG